MNGTSGNTSCIIPRYKESLYRCSEDIQLHYKVVSFTLASIHTVLLSLHLKNWALRILQANFKINFGQVSTTLNIFNVVGCISGIVSMSNFRSIHHSDHCASDVSMDMTTSILIAIVHITALANRKQANALANRAIGREIGTDRIGSTNRKSMPQSAKTDRTVAEGMPLMIRITRSKVDQSTRWCCLDAVEWHQ